MDDDEGWIDEITDIHEMGLAVIELCKNWPEVSRKMALTLAKVSQLAEINERILMGIEQPGDGYAAKKALLGLSNRDLIRIILELGRADQNALMPWQIKIEDRRETVAMKARQKRLDSASRQDAKIRFEDAITLRVIKYRHSTGATLVDALQAVAAGTDRSALTKSKIPGFVGLLGRPQLVYSAAKIRAAYMNGIKRVKSKGYAIERKNKGLFGGGIKIVPLGKLTTKGRRRGF